MRQLKRLKIGILLFGCVLLIASSGGGCRQSNNPAQKNAVESSSANKAANSYNACQLLTSDDIKEVQGEAATDSKATSNAVRGIVVSQCFYQTPTFSNSVSIQITQKNPSNSAPESPKELWEQQFSQAAEKEKDSEAEEEQRERGKAKKDERAAGENDESDKEENSKPQEVEGVGDEAFWVGNRLTGALYVLKGDSFLRISIGGAEKPEQKIAKLKTLAERALKRF